jgi:L-ascorbate metabolism protein UlaG (beta-lactamase superfamily)
VALLPIGAYEPRWFMGAQHMNPDDAVRAHLDLAARHSIAMHFATFHLTDEAIDAPVEALDIARRVHGVSPHDFLVPRFGEPLRFLSVVGSR